MADDNDPALLPEGKTWLEAAKRGDVHAMKPLLAAQPRLLGYRGKGCPLGFIGHSALHWAAYAARRLQLPGTSVRGPNLRMRGPCAGPRGTVRSQRG
jgi:hypothetical protein